MINTLFLLCGPSGVGKSTWLKNTFLENWDKSKSVIVSRDEIRFYELRKDNLDSEHYFDKEPIVFATFLATIASELLCGNDVYADATHLTPASRSKVIKGVEKICKEKNPDFDFHVVALDFSHRDMEKHCLYNNSLRTGLARVPEEAIKNQCRIYKKPTTDEYKIVYVKEMGCLC